MPASAACARPCPPVRRRPRHRVPATPYLPLARAGEAVARYRRLAAALPGTAIHYAVKANPEPAAARRPARGRQPVRRGQPGRGARGAGGGCVAADLVYSNPVKRRADIAFAAARGVRLFVVDTPEETAKVAAVAPDSVGALPAGHVR